MGMKLAPGPTTATPAPQAKRDSRRSERIRAKFIAEWITAQGDVPGEVVNVSLHGLFFETRRTSQTGQLIRLRLYVPDGRQPIECFAWVRFCDAVRAGGMGIELFAMSHEERERWNAYYHACLAASRKERLAAETSGQPARRTA